MNLALSSGKLGILALNVQAEKPVASRLPSFLLEHAALITLKSHLCRYNGRKYSLVTNARINRGRSG